jgi:PhnB protein
MTITGRPAEEASMPKNPPEGMPRVTPYLFYNDPGAALEWLHRVFGFEKRFEMPGPDGSILHAEMLVGEGVIMMGPPNEEMGAKSPVELPGVNQSLYVYVDDVRSHHARAAAECAGDITEPMEMFWGDLIYTVQDLEGHRWSFAQHVKDIAPEDMVPTF